MQGTKTITPKIMYQVHLDDLVPKDNFYRKLDSELNFQFLYKATLPYYGTEGNESIDPVVFFKICLVGYLNNINSDRKLIEYCGNCLDVRLFIRYDIDEELPWHSTISRTRQLYGEEVFLVLFKKVLALCIEAGMVRGKPDARIAVKPGKARQMNYMAQAAVDDARHVITGALADFADKRDSQSLPEIAEQTIQNLKEENLTVEQIAADTGYSSGKALKFCEEKNIDAYIPNFGQYKNTREGFIYNKEKGQYECTRGNKANLPFKKIQKSYGQYEMKIYCSSSKVCKNCPLSL